MTTKYVLGLFEDPADLDTYAKLRPLPGEEHVVEYDDEFHCWAEFGADSGFCYQQFNERPEQ